MLLSQLLITAAVATQTLMPGVTYERGVRFTPNGPVAVSVVRAPRPGGLYRLAPLLSNDAILGRETVTAMQRRLAAQATAVSIGGDQYAPSGEPAGILVRGGALDHVPAAGRSSTGVDAQGALHVDRVTFAGDWRGTGQRQPLAGIDEPTPPGRAVLFTPAWGAPTPRAADAVDAVLAPFPPAAANTELAAPVTQLVPGGGTLVPPGGAVLQARGTAAQALTAEAPAGTQLVARAILQPSWWASVPEAIGGGPILVRRGRAVFRSGEAFDDALLTTRSAREAVGQLRDGSLVLVEVDGGRPGLSVGMTDYELAVALQQLGAEWASALAPGPAAELAFDGRLLSAGREQPQADALSVLYTGVYAPPVTGPELVYRLPAPANVNAVLVAPDGSTLPVDSGHRDPGTYRFPFSGTTPGRWRWRVDATDDAGAASSAARDFQLPFTAGH